LKIQRALLLLATFSASTGLACGGGMSSWEAGAKTVNLQVDTGDSPNKLWVVDDDGVLVLSLVAAECDNEIPEVHLSLTDEQWTCANEAQRGKRMDQEVNLRNYWPGDVKKTEDLANLKEKCGLDALALWAEAHKPVNAQELKCARSALPILKKAVARAAEYNKERIAKIKDAKLSDEEKGKAVAQWKAEQTHLEKGVELFSTTPLKAGEFKEWHKEFKDTVQTHHHYRMTRNLNAEANPNENEQYYNIARHFGAERRMIGTRCGSIFPNFIEKFSGVIWDPVPVKSKAIESKGKGKGKSKGNT
jgi:hypothetical protein